MKQILLCLVMLVAGLGVGRGGVYLYDQHFNPAAARIVEGDYRHVVADRPVLFVTSTCPYCKQAIAWFDSQGILYEKQVIDQSAIAKDRYERLKRKSVPVLVAKNVLIVGYQPEAYYRYLRERQG